MLVEELARGWTTLAGAVAAHLVATWALGRLGPPGIREAWLRPLARGERLATTSLGRPVAAHAHGGGWTLDGTTAMADNAPRADLYLLAAADGAGQPLLALVGRETEGLVVEPPERTLGARGLHPCVLRMDGVRPERVWAGPEPAEQVLSAACVLAAATAVGVAQAAFEAALRYSQQRTTFGQPLWQHQAVQLKLADMATGITAARLLTYAAAGETTAPPDPARAIMARLQAAPVAVGATLESMRIHGGYGYVREFPVERYYRDATRLLVRAAGRRDLAGRPGRPPRRGGSRRRRLMAYGRWLEEFTVGEVIRHWPGRTISEADCTWFALLTMNQHPLHSDAHYAATHTQHGQRVVPGPLVFSIGIGLTVADVSGKAIANLEIERIRHEAPTFIGDTLYAESTVLATRESRQPDRGTVSVETRVVNQRGERVMTFTRTALVPTRSHPTLGEAAPPPALIRASSAGRRRGASCGYPAKR